jgi:hypothetical protein
MTLLRYSKEMWYFLTLKRAAVKRHKMNQAELSQNDHFASTFSLARRVTVAWRSPSSSCGQWRGSLDHVVNPLTPELNPSAQRCLTRFFTGEFASWTVHFIDICVKNQQIHQLFIQFMNYVCYLLHVSALHCHPPGAFLVPSERCSIEEQSKKYFGWACCV